MLKLFCWVCSRRHRFFLQKQSTLAVCSRCGNPEGAVRPLVPFEFVLRGVEREAG